MTLFFQFYRPQIVDALYLRDQNLALFATERGKPKEDLFEEEGLEVLSTMDIEFDQQLAVWRMLYPLVSKS